MLRIRTCYLDYRFAFYSYSILSLNKVISNIIKTIFITRSENFNKLFTIIIPNTFNKLTTFISISSEEFIEKWRDES